jgi:hypothetical protein
VFAECCGVEGGVAVAYGDRGYLCVDVEEDISVWVVDVVSKTLLVIGNHVQAPGVKDLVQILYDLLALRAWNGGLDDWACGLIWEEWGFARWL